MLFMVCLLSLTLLNFTAADTDAKEPQQAVILVGGCGIGGTSYPQAVGLSKIIQKAIPGFNAVAQVTGCSTENCRLLDRNKVFCANISVAALTDAYKGQGKFEDPIPVALMSYTSVYYEWILTLRSDIKSIADMKGKKIAVGDPGSGNAQHSKLQLQAWGFEEGKDYTPVFLGESAAASALRDGIADVWMADGSAAQPSIVELTTVERNVNFVPLTREQAQAASDAIGSGRRPVTVAPNTYKGQSKSLIVPGGISTLATRQDADADLVYKVTRALWENLDIMKETHATGKDFVLERTQEFDIGIPWHPGAIKYYKEAGVWPEGR